VATATKHHVSLSVTRHTHIPLLPEGLLSASVKARVVANCFEGEQRSQATIDEAPVASARVCSLSSRPRERACNVADLVNDLLGLGLFDGSTCPGDPLRAGLAAVCGRGNCSGDALRVEPFGVPLVIKLPQLLARRQRSPSSLVRVAQPLAQAPYM